MSHSVRINYFSFLDLMCCALGGALLVLVIVNYDRPPIGERRTFSAEVETLFAADAGTATISVLPLANIDGDAIEPPLWHHEVPAAGGKKGLLFAAAPGTRDRAFRILVRVPKLPQLAGGDAVVPDDVVSAIQAARRLDRVGRLLDVAETTLAGTMTTEEYLIALRPEVPDGVLSLPLSNSMGTLFASSRFGPDRQYRDVRILAYVAAKIVEAPKPVIVTEAMLPNAGDDAALGRVKEYISLKSDATGQGLKANWGTPAARQLPTDTSQVILAYSEAKANDPSNIPHQLAAKGLLWVSAAMLRLTPVHLKVRVAWDEVQHPPLVFAPGDRRVRVDRVHGELEIRVHLDESTDTGEIHFAVWDNDRSRWLAPGDSK